ncbi:radial spoke head protein 4 homolog A [Coccinella septempunctata]|uniref:radial spoke head protein 4 homolog A n=1 Tax=Coccinella septempunctata TaxID=41139 RepID=UPI001D07A7DF|nr:radial spoke head protein 4 homolog A [Coccinella septempunctata]
MIYDYEPAEGEEEGEAAGSLNADSEYVHAKAFLQKASAATGENLYDHLSDVLNKILSERPQNVIDFFEEYSRKVKERRFKSGLDHLEDVYVSKGRYVLSTKLMELLKPIQTEEQTTMDPADLELADMTQNDMLQLLFYFEHAGLGLPKNDMFCLTVAMKKLVHSEPIAFIRFWGVIYGLYKNYYIVETELKEEEYMRRNENFNENDQPNVIDENILSANAEIAHKIYEEDEITVRLHQLAHEQQLGGEDSKFPRQLPPLPLNTYEKPPKVPPEPSGVGVNSKVYYVTSDLTDPWEQLPDLTPEQICVARQIYKSFTGILDQEILTYPEFPGKEKNYLRAQIARISAGTQISPLGYYTFGVETAGEDDEEEPAEDEEMEGPKTSYKINPKYEPHPLKDLIDESMSFWVHQTQYILSQGRTSWWSPTAEPERMDEAEDEAPAEEEEDRPKAPGQEAETGPPLLTPLSEDAQIESIPAWSVRSSSKIMEEFAVAVVRSHLWPGAYCFATQGKLFQNIYLGNGLKYLVTNFSPDPLPPIQQDYPQGPEIMEMFDPTGAEEEDWRIAHLPKPKPVGPEEGEEEELEEEEEEEEEED